MMDSKKVLDDVYTSAREPGSFTSADKLKRSLQRGKNVYVTVKSIKDYLKQNDTYTKHRVARKNFKRNQVISPYIDAQWQGDLAEVGNLASENGGIRYLMVLIDVVSKHIWVEPLKSKHGKVVLEALKAVFARSGGRKPTKLQTDDGTEFLNSHVQSYLKQEGIKFFPVKSDKKAAVAERVIRTLKEKIYRYMHEKHTRQYIDALQDLVASYNDTYHKSIKMAPTDVTLKNEGEVLGSIYGKSWESDRFDEGGKIRKRNSAKHRVGDFVRISKLKGIFKKGYIGNWTEEIFVISEVIDRRPFPVYKLKDWNGENIVGSFYDKEIQAVEKDLRGFWKVERIITKRRVRGRKQFLVKWEGYPDTMNSWVDEGDMTSLQENP
jgi:Integrase core domain/Chromo (CHRromatin Organisation MOdifier) domain